MKKILTLALALVLVFAIAAPALAITGDLGDPATTPTAVAPVALDAALFTAAPAYSYNAVLSYSAVAANKAYVVNELAFWGVAMKFAKVDAAKGEKFSMSEGDFKGSVLTVSSTAFVPEFKSAYEVLDGKTYTVSAGKLVSGANNTLTYAVEDGLWGTGYEIYYFGQGLVAAKGLLTATMAKTQVLDAATSVTLSVNGVATYEITNPARGYRVAILAGDNKGNFVDFDVDAKGNVTSIDVNDQKVSYTVPVGNAGAVLESIGTLTGDALADAKAAYTQVMSFFGFDYNAKGLLQDKHFLAKSSALNLKDEAAVNLYTGSIEIPGGVTPPKTGDAASIMGFAMIVVALVACGVVVSRKVRA
jgi:hypothetical protein